MQGLWTVEFGSNTGMFGGGVVVFENGTLMGGDGGYYYIGTYRIEGANLQATVTVSPFIEGYESVFRTMGRPFSLELRGTLTDETHAVAQGHPTEMPQLTLGVKLTKRSS
jgi:hypothetical protein